ncbi:Asp-tRNA(Asn)/Glu-tRNA(Gln) amidotransferase subunit GatA [Ferrovibrio sp. MS7]|jgi:aspartyl-tRNA(Asn)/glutamyl-tRNA(Gln) amidotransferase subunit A|uniref:Asp-tRNA(Asn)/Glu-tRNA(Gln) amidotransferase subunit GatA n=1 Tax=Ferrovibrio plantarum TaxID=3119164 RepID=UPI003134DDA7
MSLDPARLTIADALAGLAKKEFTSVELTEACIKAMQAAKPLNAVITETPEQAIAMARASDARRAAGSAGLLDGIPIAVKDLFCTEGVLTTAASHILDGFKPAYESTATAKLWAEGAVMLGKVNLDEFAMGSSTESSYYGPTVNPWRGKNGEKLVPGGSSGGSAAAVAAGFALGATATDTGGSIRQPAALCGVTGIKPTYGRVSRWGIIAYASSLDQAGPMGKTVRDCALLLQGMAGFDTKDSTSVDLPVADYTANLDAGVKGLRIGIPREYRMDGMNPEIAALWERGKEWLRAAGAEVVDISLPHTYHALAAYYIVAPAEASSNLARYDGVRYGLRVPGKDLTEMYENTRGAGFGREVQRRIMIGTYVLSAGYYDAYYTKAQKVRTLIKKDFDTAFQRVDAILTPTSPNAAFPIGANSDDPVAMYLNDVFTVPINLAGVPAISVPTNLNSDGLPLGLQLIGKPFDEATLLRVARSIEQAADYKAMPEAWWSK